MSFIEVERSVRPGSWTMQGLHAHPHYEIYYLYQGSRQLLLRQALGSAQGGDVGADLHVLDFLHFAPLPFLASIVSPFPIRRQERRRQPQGRIL